MEKCFPVFSETDLLKINDLQNRKIGCKKGNKKHD